jgi:hypothetical protein
LHFLPKDNISITPFPLPDGWIEAREALQAAERAALTAKWLRIITPDSLRQHLTKLSRTIHDSPSYKFDLTTKVWDKNSGLLVRPYIVDIISIPYNVPKVIGTKARYVHYGPCVDPSSQFSAQTHILVLTLGAQPVRALFPPDAKSLIIVLRIDPCHVRNVALAMSDGHNTLPKNIKVILEPTTGVAGWGTCAHATVLRSFFGDVVDRLKGHGSITIVNADALSLAGFGDAEGTKRAVEAVAATAEPPVAEASTAAKSSSTSPTSITSPTEAFLKDMIKAIVKTDGVAPKYKKRKLENGKAETTTKTETPTKARNKRKGKDKDVKGAWVKFLTKEAYMGANSLTEAEYAIESGN